MKNACGSKAHIQSVSNHSFGDMNDWNENIKNYNEIYHVKKGNAQWWKRYHWWYLIEHP